MIRDYLRTFARNGTTADDLAQQTYVNAYAGLERGSVPRDVRSWFFGIARRVGYSHLRAVQKYRGIEWEDQLEEALSDETLHEPLESLLSEEDRARVQRVIDALPHAERQFIYAYYAPDRERYELVDGRGYGAAKTHAFRIRRKLRRLLEDHE